MPMIVGAAVVVVVAIVFVLRGGNSSAAGTNPAAAPANPQVAAPAASPTGEKVKIGAAKTGKTPARAAPTLSETTLQELSDLLTRVKALRNESVTARTGSADVKGARAKMGEAKTLLDQWKAKVESQLLWQEEAQMGDWAQPAEYLALENLYATFQRLDNEVRKGGG